MPVLVRNECLHEYENSTQCSSIHFRSCVECSFVPRPEEKEEEKGPGFSGFCMHFFGILPLPHTIDILSYTCDAILMVCITLSVDLLWCVKKLTRMNSSSGRFEAIIWKV